MKSLEREHNWERAEKFVAHLLKIIQLAKGLLAV
jgi:hypothetical protein